MTGMTRCGGENTDAIWVHGEKRSGSVGSPDDERLEAMLDSCATRRPSLRSHDFVCPGRTGRDVSHSLYVIPHFARNELPSYCLPFSIRSATIDTYVVYLKGARLSQRGHPGDVGSSTPGVRPRGRLSLYTQTRLQPGQELLCLKNCRE